MRSPTLIGVIERRLLINYRVDPEIAAGLLPAPFRPQLVNGHAVAGICLLRLGELRPVGFPRMVGQRSENVAHRIAVEWDRGGEVRNGVFINRRDSGSWLNVAVGGRVFPGVHHGAHFDVTENADTLAIEVLSRDQLCKVEVRARVVDQLEGSQLFEDLDSASIFFERGSCGFSSVGSTNAFEAMELSTNAWEIEPLVVDQVRSSYFDDSSRFPNGSAIIDCGLVMRQVPVRWLGLPRHQLDDLLQRA